MKRRKFIKRSLYTLAGLGLFGGFYAWQIEPFWLEFVRQKMPVRNLPKDLHGKLLMQISDLHVGNRFDYKYLIKSLKKAKKFNPDFVVYTGDFVNADKDRVEYDKLIEVLGGCVKGKYATVGILGNHDYGWHWSQEKVAEKVSQLLGENGISLLRNQQQEFAGLNFIGFDDYWGLNFNPGKVMDQLDPSKANIVLCHNPDVCDLDVWNNYKGWILSGHTHGGQVKPPFLPPPVLPVKNKKYTAGKFELADERTLYINRALGHLIQVRFNVRPEITIFELEAV
jgi:uncharacterized protein